MNYEAKYNMSRQENIAYAKRMIVDTIWKEANLESLNLSFPDTYAIYEKATLNNVSTDAVLTVNNLKHAWGFVFNTLDQELNLDFLIKLNGEVARGESLSWNCLRNGPSGISGTTYIPPIPNANKVSKELNELLKICNPIERAIDITLWGCKSQLFWDGNKRTSFIAANKIFIEEGLGVFVVDNDDLQAFAKLLSNYYETDISEELKDFLYSKAIGGVNLMPDKEKAH